MALMRRLVSLLTVGLLAVACGSGGSGADSEVRITDSVAADLARRSELVARLSDDGKACAAQRQARALAVEVEKSTRNGALPPALANEIDPVVKSLVSSIQCAQPTSQPATQVIEPAAESSEPGTDESESGDVDEKKDKDKKDKHGNGSGNGGEDDDG